MADSPLEKEERIFLIRDPSENKISLAEVSELELDLLLTEATLSSRPDATTTSTVAASPLSRDTDRTVSEKRCANGLFQRNAKVPAFWEICVHQVIQERCRESPESPAVIAEDGSFTYGEVDQLSHIIASALICLGVRPETFVPICMAKSRWTIVAMVGVMKSGGAFVLLDPSTPVLRLKGICQEISCTVILCCEAQERLSSQLMIDVIFVEYLTRAWRPNPSGWGQGQLKSTIAKPSNALYVAFTSGSTGKPKGVVIEHQTYCSGARCHLQAFNIDRSSRVLQFASYAFDVSIMESLSTLMAGACLCVLSEAQRTDPVLFSQAVRRLAISHAFLTPSFARTIPWHEIDTVETLVLGGEELRAADAAQYAQLGIRLMNAYGPAECSVNASVQPKVLENNGQDDSSGFAANNIGYPTGAVTWVINPDDAEKLMPSGMVGELVIEGPIVGRGYLNNPEANAKAFIDPPAWLKEFRRDDYQHRLYRTGDLVSMDYSSGSLSIWGRKDGQVKIRGQRIELGDIEHHIQQAFSAATEVIVCKVVTGSDDEDDHNNSPSESLVAVVQLRSIEGSPTPKPHRASGEPVFLEPTASYVQEVCRVKCNLEKRLPSYMIPAAFIPVAAIPRSPSGKINRGLLQATIARIPPVELQAFVSSSPSDNTKRPPLTDEEHQLQRLCAKVLKIPLDRVGMDDSFAQLGGDSVRAIRLVGAARQSGWCLTVKDLLGKVNLAELARQLTRCPAIVANVDIPFSLLDPTNGYAEQEILRLAQDQVGVSRDRIEDIYPCTPLQEGMIAASISKPGMYTGRILFHIEVDVDLARLRAAWQAAIDANSILRTRIIQAPQGFLQVVLSDDQMKWEMEQNGEEIAMNETPLGNPLLRLTVKPTPHPLGHRELTLTCHHSVVDGWSLRLIFDQVQAAYRGTSLPQRPFLPFMDHCFRLQTGGRTCQAFWATEFAGVEAPVFPSLPSIHYRPSPTKTLGHTVESIGIATAQSHSMASRIYLAWALLVAHYTDSEDVVFGSTVSGRSAPVPGIEQLVGPTIATVPFRVTFSRRKDSLETLLEQIHRKSVIMIPFEQTGLQRIAKCSTDAAKACSFQSHVNILQLHEGEQVDRQIWSVVRGTVDTGMDYTPFASYALQLVFELGRNSMAINATYDPAVMSTPQVARMLHQLEHILQQICQCRRLGQTAVRKIRMVSPQDVKQLQQWNAAGLPPADNRCLHGLVMEQTAIQPNAMAVSSWDGDLTYQELISLSSSLAAKLREHHGAGEGEGGSFVAICLEKSKWAVIAIIAALRTGSSCVLLDPQHPRQRICEVLASLPATAAKILINSTTTARLTRDLCRVELQLSPGLIEQLQSQQLKNKIYSFHDSSVPADNPAFILFTSGSTGRPKGIVMSHRTLSTSIRYHKNEMNLTAATRTLHFSSYAFDVSIYEIFTTFAAGGCLCVPSEFDRKNNLAGFINRFSVNWAFLTPSTVQTLRPEEVPSLTTLVLGGEAVTQENVDTWATPNRLLVNGYGPAEATICSVRRIPATGWKTGDIGHVVGGLGWVTMPSDPNQLAAIGAIGELLIEGHILADGYLGQPDVTEAVFIEAPTWRTDQVARVGAVKSRLYRTGDLVRYQDDGSLQYIGRRDTQVKLRGQRVDLGDVETRLMRVFPGAVEVVADVIALTAPLNATVLVAFIRLAKIKGTSNGDEQEEAMGIVNGVGQEFWETTAAVQTRLQILVPSYMVPALFLPAKKIPKTVTGKVDRRALRDAILQLPPQQLQSYRVLPRHKQPVVTDAEHHLQHIWSEILQLSHEQIGANDTFLSLGGDSVMAMRMVAVARRAQFNFTVANALGNDSLSALALMRSQDSRQPSQNNVTNASAQVASSEKLQSVSTRLKAQGALPEQGEVVAVHSATQAQGFLSQRWPWNHFCFSLRGQVDSVRLQNACGQLMEAHSILRSFFTECDREQQQLTMVVVNHVPVPFFTIIADQDQDLASLCDSICKDDQKIDPVAVPPQLPTRFTLVSNPLRTAHVFILRLSHTQYDGLCIPHVIQDLEALYNGQGPVVSTSYERYLEARADAESQNKALAFWREYLQGSSHMSRWSSPAPTTATTTERTHCVSQHIVRGSRSSGLLRQSLPSNVTVATLVKAATAIVLARHTRQTDVVIGHTVGNRSLSLPTLPQIDQLVGPCVNYVPYRVVLDHHQSHVTVRDYLRYAHAQYQRSMRHEFVDLEQIIKSCTNWSQAINNNNNNKKKNRNRKSEGFGFIVQHQNIQLSLSLSLQGSRSVALASSGQLYPSSEVWICSTPEAGSSSVKIEVIASDSMLTRQEANMLADDIASMVQSLVTLPDEPLGNILGFTGESG